MRRLAGLLLAVPLLAVAVPAGATAETLNPPGVCPASGPAVCFISETHTPQVTVPAGAGDVTYADFAATVRNNGSSTATHFTITDTPFTGATIVSMRGVDAAGRAFDCPTDTGVCSYGNLSAGKQVQVDVVLAVSSAATGGANRFTLSLDEGGNDNQTNGGGKTDYAQLERAVSLLPRDGASVYSFVPAATRATLTTDQGGKAFGAATEAQRVVGTTEIPAQPSARPLAAVRRSSDAGPCPALQCAMPDWLQVSVPGFTAASDYLRTTVRVDSLLVATLKSSNPKTLTVHYRHDATTELKTLSLCTFSRSGAPTSLGCYSAVKEKDGDLTVTVYEDLNGFIRL